MNNTSRVIKDTISKCVKQYLDNILIALKNCLMYVKLTKANPVVTKVENIYKSSGNKS